MLAVIRIVNFVEIKEQSAGNCLLMDLNYSRRFRVVSNVTNFTATKIHLAAKVVHSCH